MHTQEGIPIEVFSVILQFLKLKELVLIRAVSRDVCRYATNCMHTALLSQLDSIKQTVKWPKTIQWPLKSLYNTANQFRIELKKSRNSKKILYYMQRLYEMRITLLYNYMKTSIDFTPLLDDSLWGYIMFPKFKGVTTDLFASAKHTAQEIVAICRHMITVNSFRVKHDINHYNQCGYDDTQEPQPGNEQFSLNIPSNMPTILKRTDGVELAELVRYEFYTKLGKDDEYTKIFTYGGDIIRGIITNPGNMYIQHLPERSLQYVIKISPSNTAINDVTLRCVPYRPLIQACKYNNLEVVQLLIKYGVNVHDMGDEYPPIICSLYANSLDIFKALLEAGASYKTTFYENRTNMAYGGPLTWLDVIMPEANIKLDVIDIFQWGTSSLVDLLQLCPDDKEKFLRSNPRRFQRVFYTHMFRMSRYRDFNPITMGMKNLEEVGYLVKDYLSAKDQADIIMCALYDIFTLYRPEEQIVQFRDMISIFERYTGHLDECIRVVKEQNLDTANINMLVQALETKN
jgi:hypothetical protein